MRSISNSFDLMNYFSVARATIVWSNIPYTWLGCVCVPSRGVSLKLSRYHNLHLRERNVMLS